MAHATRRVVSDQSALMASFNREEILEQLDECARAFTFPMLDNGYVYPADVRLSAYRDNTRWAIVIEVLGFQNHCGGHDGIQNCLHCFGNCLHRKPGTANEDFLHMTTDSPEGPTFAEDDFSVEGIVHPKARTIKIRDVIVPVEHDRQKYEAKGIEFRYPDQISSMELLRFLVSERRELLLASEEELRQRIPRDLPLILRLDEWHHPDLAGGELPSQSPTFQMIAEVLATGDVSRYRPLMEPNTHWSNWPDGGSL